MTGYLLSAIFIFLTSMAISYSLPLEPLPKDSTIIDSTAKAEPELMLKLTKSPTGAILRSLAIPGWGQVYNEKYWKAPLFFGGAVTLGYFIYDNFKKYRQFSNQYEEDKVNHPELTKDDELRREFYRDARDMTVFYLIAVYAVSAVDAYADAYLYDFTVDDDLSANMYLSPNGILYAGITWNF